MSIIRTVVVVALSAVVMMLTVACEDNKSAEPPPTEETAAKTPVNTADELKQKYADEAKSVINKENAEEVAAQLEKEIDSDVE